MRALLPAFIAVGLLLPFRSGLTAAPERYLNPIDLALSADGRLLYVVCEGSDEVLEVDTGARSVIRRIPVGHVPKGIAFSPDARRMYVTNSWADTVSEVDLASATLARTLKTGFEPHSVALDKSGKFLYTANRTTNDIS